MSSLYFTSFRAMGCEVTIQVETDADGDALLRAVPGQIEAIEARLSRFRPESELMQLNHSAGSWFAASDVLYANVHAARHAALISDGLFNPLVLPALLAIGYDRSFELLDAPQTTGPSPIRDWHGIELRSHSLEVRIPAGSAIDLGGIAKGWTAAALADDLAHYGPCLVNIGGDMVARGDPAELYGWPVDIGDPFSDGSIGRLALRNTAVATSGVDYRRWQTAGGESHHHIIDPRTGRPAQTDVLSATVVHPHAPTAEAYAKAVLLLGAEAGLNWLNQRWYASGLVVQHDGTILSSSNLPLLLDERVTS